MKIILGFIHKFHNAEGGGWVS